MMDICVLKDPKTDSAEYLVEMLDLWGSAGAEACSISEVSGYQKTIIVPSGVVPEGEGLRTALSNGAHLILIAPRQDLLKRLEIDFFLDYENVDALTQLRLVKPLLQTFSHHPLPILGRRAKSKDIVLHEGTTVWAYMYTDRALLNSQPAVWSMPRVKGVVTVFAYDLVECYRNLRQGPPKNAGTWIPRDDNDRAAFIFGEKWLREFESCSMPVADFHPMLLLRLIEDGRDIPSSRLWQLPGFEQSAVLISGDEDWSTPQDNEEICSFLNTIEGNMIIYIIPWMTQCDRADLESWMEAGHSFSVHPYPTEDLESATGDFAEYRDYLKKAIETFKKNFDLPVRSLRNHRLYWSGYTDLPELWEELGIEMDCNYGYNFVPGGYSGFFSTPAASLPISFLDAEFHRINVLQHPCHMGDDTSFHPDSEFSLKLSPESTEAYAEALVENTLKPLGIPFGVCFHPVNYTSFAGEAERRFLVKAKTRGAALISDTNWLDFWQMRRSWRLTFVEQVEGTVSYSFMGNTPSRKLSVSLPAEHNGRRICEILVEDEKAEAMKIKHFGQERILVALPDAITSAKVTVSLREVQ